VPGRSGKEDLEKRQRRTRKGGRPVKVMHRSRGKKKPERGGKSRRRGGLADKERVPRIES